MAMAARGFSFVEEVDESAVPMDPAAPVAVVSLPGTVQVTATRKGAGSAGADHECGRTDLRGGKGRGGLTRVVIAGVRNVHGEDDPAATWMG